MKNKTTLDNITEEKAIKVIKKVAKKRGWEIILEDRLNFAIHADGLIIQRIEYSTPTTMVRFWRLRLKDYDGKENKIEGSYKDICLRLITDYNKIFNVIYL